MIFMAFLSAELLRGFETFAFQSLVFSTSIRAIADKNSFLKSRLKGNNQEPTQSFSTSFYLHILP